MDDEVRPVTPAEVPPIDRDVFAERHRRIAKYTEMALGKPITMESMFELHAADLMGYAATIAESTQIDIAKRPKTLEQVDPLLPAIGAYSRVTRQLGNLANTIMKLEDRHGAADGDST
jgi:hypothetical protein